MIEFSPYRNSDSPGVVAIWNQQPRLRGRLHPLTTAILEQLVLAKPYFDPKGLIIARESGRVVGFSHAGFAPGLHCPELVCCDGIVCQLMVVPGAETEELTAELLQRAEGYLTAAGAVNILGGGLGQHAPFYLGIYGGCRVPGVLVDDAIATAFRRAGYVEHHETIVWQRTLDAFRAPVDRETIALRRQLQLKAEPIVNDTCWRDTCTYGWVERTRFDAIYAATGAVRGGLTFWDMEPLASNWGSRAMGLLCADLPPDVSRGTCLACYLAESLKQFQSQGINLIEIQTDQDDSVLAEVCRKLGFQEVDRGIQFHKPAAKTD